MKMVRCLSNDVIGLTRENPIWKYLDREDLEEKRYKISSNGDIFDNILNKVVVPFKQAKCKHKLVKLCRKDGTLTIGNVTSLVVYTFISKDIKSSTEFYFVNNDHNDTYVHNIGFSSRSLTKLTDRDIHHICNMIESHCDDEEICRLYNFMQRATFLNFLRNIRNGKVRKDISKFYQI
jgi:hypothetical protein